MRIAFKHVCIAAVPVVQGMFLALATLPVDAAPCPPFEAGTWINKAADAKEPARVEIEVDCSIKPVELKARVFTRCAPRDCKWGWTSAYRRPDGVLTAEFSGFFSRKELTMRPLGNRLEISVYTHFEDGKRPSAYRSYKLERD
ncbi:hypothetical protein [Polycladidibacter hongkongensis]|uniref:hypothetical protein n=1 Tax=Polycladidibacter hongkongensis TaxID=1647556 RepID=UPI00082C98B7|nr:hypothetical protein [Pseudovibrio hongkongensis]